MKALIGFATRILEARPQTTFTVLTSAVLYKRCLDEIARIGTPANRFRYASTSRLCIMDLLAHTVSASSTLLGP
jgi:hypothetical protein